MSIDNLKQRVQTAYENFKSEASEELHDKVMEILEKVHNDTHRYISGESDDLGNSEFAQVLSLLEKTPKDSKALPIKRGELPTEVKPDGTMLGVGKWEILDPGWAISFEQWLIHLDNKAPFNNNPQRIKIPNNLTIAIAGDWGTGEWRSSAPSQKVAKQMEATNSDLTIHLGDVYYAGTAKEESDNFVKLWPLGKLGGLTLNSNHEMYNGAHSYFNIALKEKFKLQNECSFFCLENDNWLIIGLDTAYDANKYDLYLKGKINQQQLDWLKELPKNKKIMILSHHEGLNIDGEKKGSSYQELVNALGREPDVWYWGHLHNAIVYKQIGKMYGRCVGHGAIPYGDASILKDKPNVIWYETSNANDPDIPLRVKNGFVLVELNNNSLIETMITEDGDKPFNNKIEF